MLINKYVGFCAAIFLSLVLLGCGENVLNDEPTDFKGKIFFTEMKACISMSGESVEARSEIKFTEDGEMCIHEACSDTVNCAIDPVIDGRTIDCGLEKFYLSEDGKKIMDSKGEVYYLF